MEKPDTGYKHGADCLCYGCACPACMQRYDATDTVARLREAVQAVERGAMAGHRRADGRPAEYRIPAQDFWGLCVLIGVKLDPEAEAEGRVFLQSVAALAAEQGEPE